MSTQGEITEAELVSRIDALHERDDDLREGERALLHTIDPRTPGKFGAIHASIVLEVIEKTLKARDARS